MADDIELDIGLNFDDQIVASYDRLIKSLTQKTQAAILETLDNVKGAVSKKWGEFPFASMHSKTGGALIAEKAFLTSLAVDLQKQGYDKSSNEFKAALLNAQYASAFSDPIQRYRRMQAEGYSSAAALTAPGTALGKTIQQDWEFLRSSWARDFVVSEKMNGLKREELEKLHIPQLKDLAKEQGLKVKSKTRKDDLIDALIQRSNESDTHIDFGGMRKMYNMLLEKQMLFAGKVSVEDLEAKVAAGEGKWKLPYGPHREDNFEPIIKGLDTIDSKAGKAKKSFEAWGHALKGALGAITAIGSTALKIGGAIVGAGAVAYRASESMVLNSAASMDKRRGFLGMSLTDVAETQVAGRSVGLGEGTIFSEIEKLSSQREEFLKLGKGLDPLYSSLQGTFGILAGEKDPYKAYKAMADKLYSDLKGKSEDDRKEALMLLDKQGLGGMAHLVGAMLSNEGLAKTYETPSAFFKTEYNPYREGAYGEAELLTPQIAKLNESLKASYTQMAKDWETAFGVPFKSWWNNTLINTIIPWFEKIAWLRSDEAKNERTIGKAVHASVADRNKAIEAYAGEYQSKWAGWYQRPRHDLFVTNTLPTDKSGSWVYAPYEGKKSEQIWNFYNKFAESKVDINDVDDLKRRDRVRRMIKTLDSETGLSKLLTNKEFNAADVVLYQAMDLGARSEEGMKAFNAIVNAMLETGSKHAGTEKILEALNKIAENTGNMTEFLKDSDVQHLFMTYGGKGFAEQMQHSYSTPTDINRQ